MAEWLLPLDAGEIVLILDACYSAASVEAGDFRPGPLGSSGLGQLAYDKRIRVLAAAQSGQLAREPSSLKMGLLAYALVVDGLEKRQADWQPADGHILLREWLRYGQKRVPTLYLELLRAAQVAGSKGGPIVPPAPKETAVQRPAFFDFAPDDRPGVEVGQGSSRPVNSPVGGGRGIPPRQDSPGSVPQVPPPAPQETAAVLTVVSGFPSRPGVANQISGIPLKLMRDDFATTLNRAGIKTKPGARPKDVLLVACAKSEAECRKLINASVANPVSSAVADFSGRGTFRAVPPGTYYVMIYAQDANRQPIHWNLRVNLHLGANTVTLGPENAVHIQ